jgi:hypothetical protein
LLALLQFFLTKFIISIALLENVPPDTGLQKRATFTTLNVGLAGTGNRARATCVAISGTTRSAIHYACRIWFIQFFQHACSDLSLSCDILQTEKLKFSNRCIFFQGVLACMVLWNQTRLTLERRFNSVCAQKTCSAAVTCRLARKKMLSCHWRKAETGDQMLSRIDNIK